MFLRNCWYVAAWEHEIGRHSLLRRILLNEPVVLFRSEHGAPVALEDRCCHRHAQLSKGQLIGEDIECPYHGFRFDIHGKCTLIPGQETIPHDACVRAYPTVERDRFIWIWMGDPAKADPGQIEDFHWMDDPQWLGRGERLDLEANYFLLVENLLDLSHLSYVHRTTLGTERVAETPMSWEETGRGVRVTRWILDSPAPPFFQKAGGFGPTQNVDRWQIIDCTPASLVRLDVGCALSGTGAREGNRSQGISLRNMNAITPETERTTHYFWATARNFKLDKRFVTDLVFNNVHAAFMEDLDVLKAQQENHDLSPNARRVNMRHDGGGIAARRKIEQLIASESANPSTSRTLRE